MAKKKETITDLPEKSTTEATEPIEPSEADAAQVEAMADLFDIGEEAPAEESTEKEPEKGQPPEKEKKKADGVEKKGKELAETTKETPEEKKTEDKVQGKEETTEKEGDEDLYEVKTSDGIRHVPVKNLLATYQQFHSLQKKHEALKPILDLAEETQTPIPALYAFLRFGVAKAMEQQKGAPDLTSKPGTYEGPFKDKEEADYIEQTDPTVFNALNNAWKRNQAVRDEIENLKATFQQGNQVREKNEGKSKFTETLNSFAQKHKEPFGQEGEHLGPFKEFLKTHFYHYPAAQVNEQFFEAALAQYSPDYFKRYLANQARSAAREQQDQEKDLFGESASIRSGQGKIKLDEQQLHMADMFDT